MSLEMNTFVESIDDSIIPKWLARFEELGMSVEIHPEFSFSNQTGFLPFKLRLYSPAHEEWANKHFLTGFEFYIDNFDLKETINQITPKPTGIKKLFGSKPKPVNFVNPEVDARLEKCSKVMSFVWGSADSFELRMATTSSAILAELTNGVCAYPADNLWYENASVSSQIAKEAQDYEASLKPREFRVHEFENWL